MVIINQSNNPVYAQVQPSNFTSNDEDFLYYPHRLSYKVLS